MKGKEELILMNFPKKYQKALDWVDQNYYRMKVPLNLPKAICHEELGSQHCWFKNQSVYKIIDWDIGYNYMFYDLGTTLYFTCLHPKTKKISIPKMARVVYGYNLVRPLTQWEEDHIYECYLIGTLKYFS